MNLLQLTFFSLAIGATQLAVASGSPWKITSGECDGVVCSSGPRKQLIPGDVELCESGVYCECDLHGIPHRDTCPLPELFHGKLNPDTQDCESSFDCKAWMERSPTESPESTTTPPPPPQENICSAIDCRIADKQLVPGDLSKCENGLYCECDSRGVAHEQTCFLGSKFNPDSGECEFSFDCETWVAGPTTVNSNETTSQPEITTPRQENICLAIDCSIADKQLVPGDLAKCEDGLYCECDSRGVAHEQTCFLGSKFNPDSGDCEFSFDCEAWVARPTADPAATSPENSTPVQENICVAVNCSIAEKQLVPGDFDKCEDGLYCECDGWGLAHEQKCLLDSKFNPIARECEFSFDCRAWFGLEPTRRPHPTGAPGGTTPRPANNCLAVDCSIAEAQLIPGDLEKCEHGAYCECDDWGVAHERSCVLAELFNYRYNPETGTCETSFDCKAWMDAQPTRSSSNPNGAASKGWKTRVQIYVPLVLLLASILRTI